jgi:hypothetical protein
VDAVVCAKAGDETPQDMTTVECSAVSCGAFVH